MHLAFFLFLGAWMTWWQRGLTRSAVRGPTDAPSTPTPHRAAPAQVSKKRGGKGKGKAAAADEDEDGFGGERAARVARRRLLGR